MAASVGRGAASRRSDRGWPWVMRAAAGSLLLARSSAAASRFMAASCAVTGPYQASAVGSGGGFGTGAGAGAQAARKRAVSRSEAWPAFRPAGKLKHAPPLRRELMSRVYAGCFVSQALHVFDVGTGVHNG